MGREANRLTALEVTRKKRPGLYADGGGLCLQVQPRANDASSATKAWIFRYMLAGRPHKMGMGPVALVPLAEARDKALAYRRQLLAGVDPLAARAAERANAAAEALRSVTFGQCAERYVAAHRAGWKNDKHAAQWDSTIATYVDPVIGDLSVAAIDTAAVMKVLEQETGKPPKPFWQARPDTAGRVRGRIETILNWASARGYRTGENPARWRGHIDRLLPALSKLRKVEHHAALPYQELPAFLTTLRAREGVTARALEFTILTAARTGEVIGARRAEFDHKARMWTIPGSRMKSGREHRVPLSDRAQEILATLQSEGEFVFPGRQPGSALSNMAMLETLKQMGRGDLTTHGFRSTFRDWAAEMTAYPHELQEMALAHVVSDKVEAAYRRGDMVEKRRRLMADWAQYCSTRVKPTRSNVMSIRRRAP